MNSDHTYSGITVNFLLSLGPIIQSICLAENLQDCSRVLRAIFSFGLFTRRELRWRLSTRGIMTPLLLRSIFLLCVAPCLPSFSAFYLHSFPFVCSRLWCWARSVCPSFWILRARLHHRVLPDTSSHQLRRTADPQIWEWIPCCGHPPGHGPQRHAGRLLFCQARGGVTWQHVRGTPQQRWAIVQCISTWLRFEETLKNVGLALQWKCGAFTFYSEGLLELPAYHMHLLEFVWMHVKVEGFYGCLPACDCAEATRILSCHISVQVLEEKKSRPSGWLVVQANPTCTL